MTTYLSPGVYIKEVPSGPQPISAAPSSVVAIIGTTARGPAMEPTRITGWGEYVDRFGAPVASSFTAEAMAGFFENGGPAAYVVRVDPSTASAWMARDANDDDVFRIEASSPGAWSSGMTVIVTPSIDAGLGRAWSSTVVSSAGSTTTVSSASGLRVGDTIADTDGNSETVDSVTGNVVGLGGASPFADGASVFVEQNAATINLSSLNGIEIGDLLIIEVPGSSPTFVEITGISPQQDGGATVDLAAATDVPGGAVAPRTARYPVSLSTPGLTTVTLAQLDLKGTALSNADLDDGYRMYLDDGRIASWDNGAGHFVLPGGAVFPIGDAEAEAGIRVSMYNEPVELTNPTLDDLAELFSWVPDGAKMVLNPGGVEIDKTGTSFTTADVADLTAAFTSIQFDPDGSTTALVTAPRSPVVGDSVDLGAATTVVDVLGLGGDLYQLELADAGSSAAAADLVTAFQQTRIVPYRFGLTVSDGVATEVFTNLALTEGHSRHYARDGLINDASVLITVGERLSTDPLSDSTMPVMTAAVAAGADRPAAAQDMIAGINQLERESEPAILICPDALTLDDPALQGSVIGALTSHAEQFRRFAVIDTPRESNDQDLVDWRLEHVNSIYAASYAPHVKILNLDGDAPERFRIVPPSGVVAGVFARTDRERGVHKAPANERVRGIVGLDQDYTQRRQDLLNPKGVNLIRSFPSRGRRIWGARNATDDTTWRYVNVRRLFNVIETSIERGTQWVVFEPNTASTWLRVRVSVENFLNGLWSAGALAGNSPEEAYRVRVGLGETMTEAQIDLGLIIIQVAVAAAKPAEFVVFEFSHKRLSE